MDHDYQDMQAEHRSNDLSAVFGIAIGLALGALLQVGLFLGLHSLWQRFFG